MSAYYNEHDAQKAAWLRELMRRNLIAPGEVDERAIEEVQPADVKDFDQCHWFAGIGVWSYALRNAGWSDSSRVWTGSCPCPSFSTSGKGLGFDDPRHLWPAWFRLLRVVRPDVVFGEQVASDSALAWLDLVSSDLEGEDYAIGAADLCAAGVGAPHIRQRLYFVADTWRGRRDGGQGVPASSNESDATRGSAGDVAHPESERRRETRGRGGRSAQWVSDASEPSELGNASIGWQEGTSLNGQPDPRGEPQEPTGGSSFPRIVEHPASNGLPRRAGEAGPESGGEPPRPSQQRSGADGFWREVEWLPCRDGKARPVEPGTFPLAHGAPARVVRLRGYGDAIVAPLAQAFIEAYQEVRGTA